MSISSEITRIQNKRDLSFQEVQNKGVTVPAGSTIDDLPGLIALIEGGGSSSEGEVLLGSGTFTLATDTSIMSIPISISGVPTIGFVEASTFSTTGNATAVWILFAQKHQEVHSLFMDPSVLARISVAASRSYTGSRYMIDGSVSLTTSNIQVRQYSGSIPIRANTYNWYVWGLKS